jgi:hypothetical protein
MPHDLTTLRDRVAGLTVADRDVDNAIRVAFGYPPKPWNYTASVDAAMAFVERVLPGWVITLHGSLSTGRVDLHDGTVPYSSGKRADSGSLARPYPIALLRAALSALATLNTTEQS